MIQLSQVRGEKQDYCPFYALFFSFIPFIPSTCTKHLSLLIPFLPFKPILSPLRSESGKAERSPWEVELAKLP